DLGRGATDRVHRALVELPELVVDLRRRTLDQPERADDQRRDPGAADREVQPRPLRLRAVVGVLRHAHLTHRVLLDPVVTHRVAARCRSWLPRVGRTSVGARSAGATASEGAPRGGRRRSVGCSRNPCRGTRFRTGPRWRTAVSPSDEFVSAARRARDPNDRPRGAKARPSDAGTGTRTRTPLREADFKSAASTDSAIPAGGA